MENYYLKLKELDKSLVDFHSTLGENLKIFEELYFLIKLSSIEKTKELCLGVLSELKVYDIKLIVDQFEILRKMIEAEF